MRRSLQTPNSESCYRVSFSTTITSESIGYLPQILVKPLGGLSGVHRQSSVGAGQSKVATMPTTKYGNKLDGYTRLFQRGFHVSSFFEGNDFVRVAVKE